MEHINYKDFKLNKPAAVTIGNFDGLHRGHTALVEKTMEAAAGQGLSSVVFSFSPHPSFFLRNGPPVKMIVSPEEKAFLLESMGVDYFIEYPFTEEFSRLSAREFVKSILAEKLCCRLLVIGEGYRFGRGGESGAEQAEELGGEYGFSVAQVPHVMGDGEKISSTAIRKLISLAELGKAQEYLGRFYFIMGRVENGRKVGRTLGFPTVNLLPYQHKLLPPNGVYVTKTLVMGKEYGSVTNVGCNPTVNGDRKTVETYILDFDNTVYGEIIQVTFYKKIRGEIKFTTLDQLKSQIMRDKAKAMEYHGKN